MQGLTQRQQEMLRHYYPGSIPFDGAAVTVRTDGGEKGITVERRAGACTVTLGRESLLGRALTLLEEGFAQGGDFSVHEEPSYDLGIMVDCSRGAVPRPETLRRLIVQLSRMGYTAVQLYVEDTYELPGYPYFGYRRGGYSREDLRGLDEFAGLFGIELIPAIQTLAHLGQSLKWPAMERLCDVGDILLVDDEETYALIDRMFETLSGCFHSRRINIGMDEAHLLGLGKYLDRHGYQNRVELMLRHCGRVVELARKHGLRPMMWSDMFFRLATGGDYYAPDCKIDPEVAKSIPEDLTLVYWDYYSEQRETYERMIERHQELTDRLIFAGGAWKWMGFGPNNLFSFRVARMAHAGCKGRGVGEVLITSWADNGAECPLFAVLPALAFWAELCYAGDESRLAGRFAIECGGELEAFLRLDEPMLTPDNPAPGRREGNLVNPTKYLLYQDVLGGLFDAHVDADTYEAHFARCAERLGEAAKAGGDELQYLFESQKALCEVLEIKCRAGIDLRAAYERGDREALARIRDEALPELQRRLEAFSQAFRRQWLRENRAAGLDTFDLRIGGLKERVAAAIGRVGDYLDGRIPAIEELDVPLLTFDGSQPKPGGSDVSVNYWHMIASASNIALI